MPVKLKNLSGTKGLTCENARKWLSSAGYQIPQYLDNRCLEIFLSTREKTYGFLQCQEFLLDIDGFYYARKGINIALKNLNGYDNHLKAQRVTNELALQVLGIKGGKKISQDLLAFVLDTIESVLKEEHAYVAECRLSLETQLQWHQSGPVDKGDISTATLKSAFSVTKTDLKDIKGKAKYAYYEPIRNRLMNLGFVVSPPGAALGAVFPGKDWIRNISDSDFWKHAKAITDELVMRYHLIGDDPSSLTRLLKLPPQAPPELTLLKGTDLNAVREAFVSAVGCLCVSWTRYRASRQSIYVPILGLSGVVQEKPNALYFQRFCRYLGLPTWEPDPQIPTVPDYEMSEELKRKHESSKQKSPSLALRLKTKNLEDKEVQAFKQEREQLKRQIDYEKQAYSTQKAEAELGNELWVNYETMIRRTNLAALGYRARTLLQLRMPARQALLSYVSFREDKSSKSLKIESLQRGERGVDLWICGWHSLNCAEPAALMTASSYFCEGCDVLVCFPYEGFSDTGPFRNRPKETCPWCAAVELAFRSLSKNTGRLDTSIKEGTWLTQFTRTLLNEPETVLPVNRGFDAFDDENPIMKKTRTTLGGVDSVSLVKNKDLDMRAYSDVVETKIGRVRSMYHLLGLLDPEVVALDRPLFKHAGPDVLWQLDRMA